MIKIVNQSEMIHAPSSQAEPEPQYVGATAQSGPQSPVSDNHRRLVALRAKKIEYIDSSEFHDVRVCAKILDDNRGKIGQRDVEAPFRPSPETPAHLARLCEQPVLDPAVESALFRRMNCLKFVAAESLAAIDDETVVAEQLDEVECQIDAAREIRDLLISANMKLVMSVAGKMARTAGTFDELLSEGCMVLMKAVEKFNVDRGFRFSTYAVTALRRQFARVLGKMATQRVRTTNDPDLFLAGIEAEISTAADDLIKAIDIQDDIQRMLDRLNDRERLIVCARFGIGNVQPKGRTLKDIAVSIGISKERVRQIQNRALEKLKMDFKGSSLAGRLDHIDELPDLSRHSLKRGQ